MTFAQALQSAARRRRTVAPGTEAATLQDPEAPATACFEAVQALLGKASLNWEPESLWLTLEREHSVDVPLPNRAKILAANTLVLVPAFWWEVHAFMHTISAFSGHVTDSREIFEATPGELAWGVFEAELLFQQSSDIQAQPEFDREPTLYVAQLLHDQGFSETPVLLDFAQPALNALVRSNKPNEGVQKAKRQGVQEYVLEQLRVYQLFTSPAHPGFPPTA
jgi:hypothetical protein